MNLAVIGTGYVGLVAGTCFAESGNDVTCVDIDEQKIAMLNAGKVPIYEPGLEEMVRRNAEEQRLSFTTALDGAVKKANVIFIAVGTPQGPNGDANLEHVRATAKGVAKAMCGFKIIVNKTTGPGGPADWIRKWVEEKTSHLSAIIPNPDFLRGGGAGEDLMNPDGGVGGGKPRKALKVEKKLYEP